MLNKQFPKLIPNKKALGTGIGFNFCAVFATGISVGHRDFFFTLFLRGLSYHFLLNPSFVSIFQGITIVVPSWIGTLQDKQGQHWPCQERAIQ